MCSTLVSIPPSERNRQVAQLRKTLALLASDHPGEVCAAAAAAARLLPILDCDGWGALVDRAFAQPAPQPPPPRPGSALDPRAQAAWCLSWPQRAHLSQWEAGFLASVRTWRGRPTPGQLAKLAEIRRRLSAGNGERGA